MENQKVKIGVFGAGRGSGLMRYCLVNKNAELVAICDANEDYLALKKKQLKDESIAYYTSFDEFLKHDMDAVVLANFATEHAPYAIRCLKAGMHVYSECVPFQTMQEAVELIETVEETGKVYNYGENFCFMAAPYEMKKLYRQGKIGEFEYAEAEYLGSYEKSWHSLTFGWPDHWRNSTYANFYCTHSIGPIVHATGLRPVSVVGFEGTKNERNLRVGSKAGAFGIEMITFENGGILKSVHGYLYKHSIWYCMYGSKGSMETGRYLAENGNFDKIYVHADEYSGEYGKHPVEAYKPEHEYDALAKEYGHGGGDFYTMHNFVEKIRGNEDADIIDVYEAADMFLPGMFAYRSVLQGGVTLEIPNLRDKAVRDQYRNDTMCTDKKVAKDMYIPPFSKGDIEIPDAVYKRMYELWREDVENFTGYVKGAMEQ